MVSGALETLTGGNTGIVVAGILVLVACGYVDSVVSGRGCGRSDVVGVVVVGGDVSGDRGVGGIGAIVWGNVVVVCGVAVVVGR